MVPWPNSYQRQIAEYSTSRLSLTLYVEKGEYIFLNNQLLGQFLGCHGLGLGLELEARRLTQLGSKRDSQPGSRSRCAPVDGSLYE